MSAWRKSWKYSCLVINASENVFILKIYIRMHLHCAALTPSAVLFSLKKEPFLKAKQGSESKTLFIRLTMSRPELLVSRRGDPASKHQYVQSAWLRAGSEEWRGGVSESVLYIRDAGDLGQGGACKLKNDAQMEKWLKRKKEEEGMSRGRWNRFGEILSVCLLWENGLE